MKFGLVAAYAAIAAAAVYAGGRYPSTPPTFGDVVMSVIVVAVALLLLNRRHRQADIDAGSSEHPDRGFARRAGQVVNRLRRYLS